MRQLWRSLRDPAPEVEWEIWYRDMFDPECPPSIDIKGRGLARGLMALWARHLFETVRPDGGEGFSRFHMRWAQKRVVEVRGEWSGAVRLRTWVFGAKQHATRGYIKEGDAALLERTAVVHANLVLANQTSHGILTAAAEAVDRKDFETRLGILVGL